MTGTTDKSHQQSDVHLQGQQSVVLGGQLNLILCVLAILFWLVPITWRGLTNSSVPFVGRYANDLYRVPALFTKRLRASVDYYFQVQLADSWGEWTDVSKREYATILMSGNRTRMDRVLQDSMVSPRGTDQRQAIAEHVKKNYEERYPDRPKIEAFRVVGVAFPLKSSPRYRGRWQEWPIQQIPEEQKNVISIHYFDGREPVDRFREQRQQEAAARRQ